MNLVKIRKQVAKRMREINSALAKTTPQGTSIWAYANHADIFMKEIMDDYFKYLSPARQQEVLRVKERVDAALATGALRLEAERETMLALIERTYG